MRLTGRSDDEPLTQAWAYLSTDPGWHCHVGGGDGAPELTIAIDT